MGRLIVALVDKAADCELVGLVGEPGRQGEVGLLHPELPVTGQDTMAADLPAGCVIVDFSTARSLPALVTAARALAAPLVIGTTGHTATELAQLTDYAQEYPVVKAANFSLGIPALQMLLQLLARTLPDEFAAEQVETHHATKTDRPSGTALHLAGVWRDRRGVEVPTHSQRVGGVVGEHSWTISNQDETLVLTHRAHSRSAFLRGILPAVRFVVGREPGLYNLTDVLQDLGTEK